MNVLLVRFVCIAWIINISGGDKCLLSTELIADESDDSSVLTDKTSTRVKICPGLDDPPDWTGCCSISNPNSTSYDAHALVQCCAVEAPKRLFYFITDRMALLIAVALTVSLLIITIVIVVCCFWTRCPLYMACRVRYRRDDIIAYASKDDETTNLNEMPPEEKKGLTAYSLNDVKITPLKDVA